MGFIVGLIVFAVIQDKDGNLPDLAGTDRKATPR
jgi:hypothetical protein